MRLGQLLEDWRAHRSRREIPRNPREALWIRSRGVQPKPTLICSQVLRFNSRFAFLLLAFQPTKSVRTLLCKTLCGSELQVFPASAAGIHIHVKCDTVVICYASERNLAYSQEQPIWRARTAHDEFSMSFSYSSSEVKVYSSRCYT